MNCFCPKKKQFRLVSKAARYKYHYATKGLETAEDVGHGRGTCWAKTRESMWCHVRKSGYGSGQNERMSVS